MYSLSNERLSNLDKGVRRNDILGIYLSLFVFVMLSVKFSVYQRPTGSLAAIYIFFPSHFLVIYCRSCTFSILLKFLASLVYFVTFVSSL